MVYYVNVNALKDGDGSKARPFRRIGDAAKIARPGDQVLVAPGVYREAVHPQNAGTEDAPIEYISQEPLGAVITGAEPVTCWTHYRNQVWTARVQNGVFGAYNPYTTLVAGDWYFGDFVYHTGAVYLGDKMLYEALSLEECLKGDICPTSWEPEASRRKWYAEQDENTTVFYCNFGGADPRAEKVEINVRRNCFMPTRNGVDYITLRGFRVEKAATTWAPPAAYQDGMVGPHWSKGWIIEDCEISNSRCAGISLGKYYDPGNDHYFTRKHVKSPTQMERDAVCRGQYHGWLKEKVGSHIVRRCHIHDCGQAGIVGRMGCVFSVIEDNEIHHIDYSRQFNGAEIAGIKLHAAIDVVFRRNHIHHNSMGIWCDWQAQGTRITQNFLHDNHAPEDAGPEASDTMCEDLFVEVGHGPTLIDNNICLSKASLRLATQGVACVHNLFAGAFTSVGGGTDNVVHGVNQPRYTPYHFPHRTEVAGFMTILHGDDRFYNNIFVQHWPVTESEVHQDMGFFMKANQVVGTAEFDGYPTYEEWIKPFKVGEHASMFELEDHFFDRLPVWAAGNVYLGGAKAWEKEADKLVVPDSNVTLALEERDGKYTLKTNVYDFLKDYRCGVISSDTLGLAFEPEQRFENPDGTDIIFDADYFGGHRGPETMPGPFAAAVDGIQL